MCDFISWIEADDGKIFFLDNRALAKYKKDNPSLRDIDCRGHEAIKKYYGCIGKEKEYTNFTHPKHFPSAIVSAIKSGRMSGHNVFPNGLLLKQGIKKPPLLVKKAYTEWEKARAKWEKAYTELEKADAECKKARAKCEKTYTECEKAAAKYIKADAECEKAYAECKKADAEYIKADAKWKWDLFRCVNNRIKAWR